MPRIRSAVVRVLLALVASVATVVLVPGPATAAPADDLLTLTNAARAAAGVRPLTAAPDLTAVAQRHSQRMASNGSLFHNPNLATEVTNWSSLAENVGYGGSIATIQDAFMNSQGHRANVLNAGFSEVGVGVVQAGSRLWVTVVFRTPVVAYVPPPPAPTCVAPPSSSSTGVTVRRDGYWYVRNSLTSGVADGCYTFGDAADVPFAGDWDGDGVRSPGVYRPSTGRWYLASTLGGPATVSVQFGIPGDRPTVGDWDGDGKDSLGLFRPSTGRWYFMNRIGSGVADWSLQYGMPGDRPAVGDWDGNGTATPGVFRPSNGRWYLSNRNDRPYGQVELPFGTSADLPVTGDWNGDGKDTIGVFRGGTIYLTDLTRGAVADRNLVFGQPGDVPVVTG